MEASLIAHQSAGFKRAQLQARVVQHALGFRVGGQQHLEASVELEAINQIRACPPAYAVTRFQQHAGKAATGQLSAASQAS